MFLFRSKSSSIRKVDSEIKQGFMRSFTPRVSFRKKIVCITYLVNRNNIISIN